ncbi:MAG: hypothetical protein NUV91_06460 [Candidatus Omnitrophica bacterium]|nr:hypothetical protein [Candidatus Omnitrophota bacterium]
MKSTLIVFVIVAWLVVIYFGFISVVGKSMSKAEAPQTDPTIALKKKQEQLQQVRDLKDQARRLQEQRRDRLR